MADKPYGNYFHLTDLGANAHKGAPLSVYWGALESKEGFDKSLQQETDRILEMEDPYGAELEELYDEDQEYSEDQEIEDLLNLHGDDLLEQVIDQEKEYNDVYSFLAGSGMDPEMASAEADASVRAIPEEEVVLLEQAYPGIVPYYDVDADDWDELGDTAVGLYGAIGNDVDAVIAELEEEDESGGWWDNFVDTVTGYVEGAIESMKEGKIERVEAAKGRESLEATSIGDFVRDQLDNIEGVITDMGINDIYTLEAEGVAPEGTGDQYAMRQQLNIALEDEISYESVVSNIVSGLESGDVTTADVTDWMGSAAWADEVRQSGFDPDELRQNVLDSIGGDSAGVDIGTDGEDVDRFFTDVEAQGETEQATATTTDTTATPVVTDATTTGGGDIAVIDQVLQNEAVTAEPPSYLEQFATYFNTLPGSVSAEAQRGMGALFNQAETIYYLMQDWSKHDWLNFATPDLDTDARGDEEDYFTNWLKTDFFPDIEGMRWGEKFYDNVRGLRDRMTEMSGNTMQDLYNTVEGIRILQPGELKPGEKERDPDVQKAQQSIYDRFAFMDDKNPTRLGTLVGMYNVHRGADNWMKAQFMNFYENMLGNWLDSGRTMVDYLQTFVKDRPVMAQEQAEQVGQVGQVGPVSEPVYTYEDPLAEDDDDDPYESIRSPDYGGPTGKGEVAGAGSLSDRLAMAGYPELAKDPRVSYLPSDLPVSGALVALGPGKDDYTYNYQTKGGKWGTLTNV
mgnify:CR=1 FL=1